jgi:hypothetical protein
MDVADFARELIDRHGNNAKLFPVCSRVVLVVRWWRTFHRKMAPADWQLTGKPTIGRLLWADRTTPRELFENRKRTQSASTCQRRVSSGHCKGSAGEFSDLHDTTETAMKKAAVTLVGLGGVAAITIGLAGPASAAQTAYSTGTIPQTDTNWDKTVTIAKFDPALGTLIGVDCFVTGTASGDAKIENLSRSASASTSVNLSARLTLAKPDNTGPIVVTIPLINDTVVLSTYDSALDFSGTSGKTYALTTGSASNASVLTAAADLAQFVAASPGDTVTLPIHAEGLSTITGGGNLIGGVTSTAGAQAGCRYNYTAPGPDPVVPEFPSPIVAVAATGGVAGAALAWSKRRRARLAN